MAGWHRAHPLQIYNHPRFFFPVHEDLLYAVMPGLRLLEERAQQVCRVHRRLVTPCVLCTSFSQSVDCTPTLHTTRMLGEAICYSWALAAGPRRLVCNAGGAIPQYVDGTHCAKDAALVGGGVRAGQL
jgi:hypothetical protein